MYYVFCRTSILTIININKVLAVRIMVAFMSAFNALIFLWLTLPFPIYLRPLGPLIISYSCIMALEDLLLWQTSSKLVSFYSALLKISYKMICLVAKNKLVNNRYFCLFVYSNFCFFKLCIINAIIYIKQKWLSFFGCVVLVLSFSQLFLFDWWIIQKCIFLFLKYLEVFNISFCS